MRSTLRPLFPTRELRCGLTDSPAPLRAGPGGVLAWRWVQPVLNRCTVVLWYVSPGRNTVDGNSGRFGESG